jgi:hypothetical protein
VVGRHLPSPFSNILACVGQHEFVELVRGSYACRRAFCAAITSSARFLALLNCEVVGAAASAGQQQHVTANTTARLTTRHFTLGAILRYVGMVQLALVYSEAIYGCVRCGNRLILLRCGQNMSI